MNLKGEGGYWKMNEKVARSELFKTKMWNDLKMNKETYSSLKNGWRQQRE